MLETDRFIKAISRPITLQPSGLIRRLPHQEAAPVIDRTLSADARHHDIAAASASDETVHEVQRDDNVSVSDSETSTQREKQGGRFWGTVRSIISLFLASQC